MRVLALAGDIDALIAEIRLRAPLAALARQAGWSLQCRSFHDCARADLAAADVLVVQRAMSARALRLQQRMRLAGGAVVYDIDDLLTDVPAHISNHAAIRAGQQWLARCIAAADVVTVSTVRLGRELGLAAAHVVPNHAPPPADTPLPPWQPGRPVTLLFASMERLAADFMMPALRALPAASVEIVVVGPAAADFAAAGVAVQAQPLLPRDAFIAWARALPNPLAAIPLEDSRFAACKSAIKWFEYAEAGIPVLCSAVSPYRDVVEHGRSGALVANGSAAWRVALRAAIGDAAWRSRIAVAARAQVRVAHTQQQTLAAWQRAVEDAVVRRAAAAPEPASVGWQVRDAGAALFESAAFALRRFNRARLARRHQARQR